MQTRSECLKGNLLETAMSVRIHHKPHSEKFDVVWPVQFSKVIDKVKYGCVVT